MLNKNSVQNFINLLLKGVLLLTLSAPYSAHADDKNVIDWLMRVAEAPQKLSYSGTFIYIHEDQIETMQVAHRVRSGVIQERLYSLNGAAREVIRDEERVWCFLPDQKIGVHEYRQSADNGFPNILPQNLNNLEKYYQIRLGGTERIADRITQQIEIHPKDDFRYGYDLWAEQATGLLLRADLLDTNQKIIEQYMFAQVNIGAEITELQLTPVTAKTDLTWYSDQKDQVDVSVEDASLQPVSTRDPATRWEAEQLPDGFMLSRRIQRISPMRKKWMEHQIYSDGLAAVSVFIGTEKDESATASGISRMGAVHAYSTMVDGYLVTVVGEVPARTVKMIANAVQRVE